MGKTPPEARVHDDRASMPPNLATMRSYSAVQRSAMISATGVSVRRDRTLQRQGLNRGARTSTVPNSESSNRRLLTSFSAGVALGNADSSGAHDSNPPLLPGRGGAVWLPGVLWRPPVLRPNGASTTEPALSSLPWWRPRVARTAPSPLLVNSITTRQRIALSPACLPLAKPYHPQVLDGFSSEHPPLAPASSATPPGPSPGTCEKEIVGSRLGPPSAYVVQLDQDTLWRPRGSDVRFTLSGTSGTPPQVKRVLACFRWQLEHEVPKVAFDPLLLPAAAS